MIEAPPNWPIQRKNFFLGYVGPIDVAVALSGMQPDDYETFFTEMPRGIDARRDSDRLVVIYQFDGSFRSDLGMVKRISDMAKTRADKIKRTARGLAVISSSMFVRAGLRTVTTFADLPYPVSAHENATTAIPELHKYLPTLDVAKCLAEYDALLRRFYPTLVVK